MASQTKNAPIGDTEEAGLSTFGQDGDLEGLETAAGAHLRAGHWHGYWTGPRDDPKARKLVRKWVGATYVGTSGAGEGSQTSIDAIPCAKDAQAGITVLVGARAAIRGELARLEDERGVRILLAVESGSRCWGFPSENSDYDVRFVYSRPASDYLRLEDVRDTAEVVTDDGFDMAGWDLAKFMRLLRGSNPSAFEWLGSHVVYHEEECFGTVREVASRCFNPVASAHHYYGMGKKHDMRYVRNGNTTYKRYLYAVRSLLACRWSVLEQKPVPMAFDELKSAMLEPEMVPIVDELVELKRNGLEKERCDAILPLNEWIFAQEESLREKIGTLEAPERVPWPVLDEIFLKIVLGDEF